jgi:hypothetical protein
VRERACGVYWPLVRGREFFERSGGCLRGGCSPLCMVLRGGLDSGGCGGKCANWGCGTGGGKWALAASLG